MDPSQQNAAIVRRFYEEAVSRRDLGMVDALVSPNVKVNLQSAVASGWNREMLKHAFSSQWQQQPDHRYVILDLIARGDRVAVRLASRFVNRVPTGTLPATGRVVSGHEMCFYRLANGLIEEVWTLIDEALVLQQVMPTPGAIPRFDAPGPGAAGPALPPEQSIPLVHYLVNQLNQRNLAIIDALFAPGYVSHAVPPGQPNGVLALKQGFTMMWAAFPDMTSVVEDVVAQGNKVAIREYSQGTHTGPFAGLPPSGKPFWIRAAQVYELAGQQITCGWGISDAMGLLRQIQPQPPRA